MKKLLTKAALTATLLSPVAIESVEAKSYFQEQYQSAAITQVVPSESVKLAQRYDPASTEENYENLEEDGLGIIILVLFLIVGLYFLPTFIAFASRSRLAAAVLVVNLFLGWTGLGWIGALVMAVLPSNKGNTIIVQQSTDGSNKTTTEDV